MLEHVSIYKSLHARCFEKVVANKLCVMVWNPNGMDDIICISELNDEPQCTFQISKTVGTFNCGQRCGARTRTRQRLHRLWYLVSHV
jgi:hypothetical protein